MQRDRLTRSGARVRNLQLYRFMRSTTSWGLRVFSDIFTDAMSDALVISGSEDNVAQRIGALRDFGIDEVYAAILRIGDDPDPATHRTLELLGSLNQSD